jgi:hypothetical protein
MYPRFVEQQIKEALGDTRVVLLTNSAGTSAGVANSAGSPILLGSGHGK